MKWQIKLKGCKQKVSVKVKNEEANDPLATSGGKPEMHFSWQFNHVFDRQLDDSAFAYFSAAILNKSHSCLK